jgi:tRNA (guanine37-N1)-methyltransferase
MLKPDVLSDAIEAVQSKFKNSEEVEVLCFSPRGFIFDQKFAHEYSSKKNLILICPRFEGVDQRVIEYHKIKEVQISLHLLIRQKIKLLYIKC